MACEKLLSIVISVYNEEAVLDKFYKAFEQMKDTIKWKHELIFVNDGSTDSSQTILEGIVKEAEYVRVISFSRNFGHEAAMIAGIDYARGDAIVCMDADLQHPLECIPSIIDKLETGVEVVNMVRTKNKSAGILKNITSSLFYKIVNKLSKDAKFKENASDFFAISKRVAEVLKKNYREKNRFLRGYVQCVGFKKDTIEYEAADRAGGQSHYSFKKLLKFSIDTIICFSDFPLRIGVYAGIIAALMGIIVLIYTLATKNSAPDGYTTIVILISFLFAILFVVVGIIGQYIAILFSETKDRPIYIIDKDLQYDMEQDNN